jgi:hypothetical protein
MGKWLEGNMSFAELGHRTKLSMVPHSCNPSPWEAEAEELQI